MVWEIDELLSFLQQQALFPNPFWGNSIFPENAGSSILFYAAKKQLGEKGGGKPEIPGGNLKGQ
jgi:hypothetical protein